MEFLSARTLPPVSAFPECWAGRLLHQLFRGLLGGVYCTLRPADSPSRLKRPSTSEAPATSLPPVPLRLLPVERTSSRAGLSTRGGPAPFTAHQQPLANG